MLDGEKEMGTMEIISTILAIIISCFTIGGFLVKRLEKMIDNKIAPIQNRFQTIENSLVELGVNDCKNYLLSYLARVELGKEVTAEETQRAYEEYDRYTIRYHQNSYVHDKWERVMKGQNDERKIEK